MTCGLRAASDLCPEVLFCGVSAILSMVSTSGSWTRGVCL